MKNECKERKKRMQQSVGVQFYLLFFSSSENSQSHGLLFLPLATDCQNSFFFALNLSPSFFSPYSEHT